MEKIEKILKKQFPDLVMAPDIDQMALGDHDDWDSLGHFNLLMLIEKTYSVRFTTKELAEIKSIGEIRSLMKKKGVAVPAA